MAITFFRHTDDGLAHATDPGTARMDLAYLATHRRESVRTLVARRLRYMAEVA